MRNNAVLEKVSENIYYEDTAKIADFKKINCNNINVKDIKETANDLVVAYIKRYDKVGL
jgi:hypothetical protein